MFDFVYMCRWGARECVCMGLCMCFLSFVLAHAFVRNVMLLYGVIRSPVNNLFIFWYSTSEAFGDVVVQRKRVF